MNPIFFTAAALVAGAVLAVGLVVFSRRRQAHENTRQRPDTTSVIPPDNIYNLTCPFCGARIGSGDSLLRCGHSCHRSCYLRASDTRCRFCVERNQIVEDEPEISDTTIRRRSIATRSPEHSGNSEGIRKSKKPRDVTISNQRVKSHRQEEAKSSENIEFKCSYCEIPMEMQEAVRLPCHHHAHSYCFETLKDVVKCTQCPDDEDSDD